MLLANPFVVIHFLICCLWCVVSPFLVVSVAFESPVVVSSMLRTVSGRCCGSHSHTLFVFGLSFVVGWSAF